MEAATHKLQLRAVEEKRKPIAALGLVPLSLHPCRNLPQLLHHRPAAQDASCQLEGRALSVVAVAGGTYCDTSCKATQGRGSRDASNARRARFVAAHS